MSENLSLWASEVLQTISTWEPPPNLAHARTLKRTLESITTQNPAFEIYSKLLIRFPNGKFKCPDLSVFETEPEEDETETVTLVPEAVIEILTKGFEKKDLEIGPPFYLSQGVRDIVVVDPYSTRVVWFTKEATRTLTAPVTVALACGCEVTL